MSPLRQRFIDDLRLRNRSPQTIAAYVLAVKKFSRFCGRSLERLGPDDIRRYQLHLIDTQASWSQFNQAVCALRFLYNVTLRRPEPSFSFRARLIIAAPAMQPIFLMVGQS